MRPDLHFGAVDLEDVSAFAPAGVDFRRANLITDALPFPEGYFDSASLMHVAEHLPQFGRAPAELARVLKPGGRLYVEGPGQRSLLMPSSTRDFPLNFYDDPTHIAPVTRGRIAHAFGVGGLRVRASGPARSWLLVMAMPLAILRLNRFYFKSGLIHLVGSYVCVEFEKVAGTPAAGPA